MKWFIKCFKQYADFKGRARRKEYWMFALINWLIGLVMGLFHRKWPQMHAKVAKIREKKLPLCKKNVILEKVVGGCLSLLFR